MHEAHGKAKAIITKALAFHEALRAKLLEDSEFLKLIRKYRLTIEHTWQCMKDLRIPEKCALCGQSEKGSCCAPEVATWYDPETLLVNLLMGQSMPKNPYYPDHCIFLGKSGCTLKARHYYCVQFLCPSIKQDLSEKNLEKLMKTAGREILAGSQTLTYLHRKIITA
ncbi:hypothetical protein [Thermodesulforhabdus norvegica]|uniref:Uncharacterized protein n=1 Tax=Thermodesulforhabdus norvegica TaxID=39841 RepID=A0A1I4SM19_9BACT|nr:hypothetical protein [Thermodesulforhabdus norvegica]SFM65568.1 hypothetical protein SAMN05660836_01046 [Thermodesulforhabdus norvegica]